MLKKFLLLICLTSFSAYSFESKNIEFMTARITHGRLIPIKVGTAKISLKVDYYDEIQSLNVNARVGILGITEDIKENVTISELLRGDSLEFGMRGADKDILEIVPSREFETTGGEATLKIWNGSFFETEKINIKKTNSGYKAYKVTKSGSLKRIIGLNINMRGYNIATMYVGKYELLTN